MKIVMADTGVNEYKHIGAPNPTSSFPRCSIWQGITPATVLKPRPAAVFRTTCLEIKVIRIISIGVCRKS